MNRIFSSNEWNKKYEASLVLTNMNASISLWKSFQLSGLPIEKPSAQNILLVGIAFLFVVFISIIIASRSFNKKIFQQKPSALLKPEHKLDDKECKSLKVDLVESIHAEDKIPSNTNFVHYDHWFENGKFVKSFEDRTIISENKHCVTFKAVHVWERKVYIVKRIMFSLNISNKLLEEVRRWVNLNNDCIVKYVTCWVEKINDSNKNNDIAYLYIQMEHCEGRTLGDYLKSESNLSENDVFVIFSQLVAGIKYLHAHNIFHEHLSFENIIIDDLNNSIKIYDFNLKIFSVDTNIQKNLDYEKLKKLDLIQIGNITQEMLKKLNIPTFDCDTYIRIFEIQENHYDHSNVICNKLRSQLIRDASEIFSMTEYKKWAQSLGYEQLKQ